MKESTLHILALRTVLHGVQASSSLIAQKDSAVFSSFFTSLFMNGVEDTALITRKIKIVGVCRMLTEDNCFYDRSPLPLAEGVVMLVKIVNHEGRSNDFRNALEKSFLQVRASGVW